MADKTEIRVMVSGVAGRMGRALVQGVARREDMRLCCAVEHAEYPALGEDAGRVAGIAEAGVAITSDFDAALPAADVVIEFALHAAVPAHARAAAAAGTPIVIGTTGLTPDETATVHAAAERTAVVWAPNMSVGINVLCEAVQRAAAAFGDAYTIEIEETHHVHKKDAPSGTALLLGRRAAAGRGVPFDAAWRHNPDGPPDRATITIRSHREGEVVGEHTVRFAAPGETIELVHHTHSRDALAGGALRAAAWLIGRPPGLYGMGEVLGL
jgi:4-hydroxy-tetrahydrodipicolinate reductase